MIDQAFILCAGFGRRLRPYTLETPKPLVKVAGRSLLERTCDQLASYGVKKAVLNTHYLSDQIKSIAPHLPFDKTLVSHEDKILDTGGGIVNALNHLENKPFFVFSGDGLWENAQRQNTLDQMVKSWDEQKMDILILLQPTRSMTLTKAVGDYTILSDDRAVRSLDQTGTHMFTSMRINAPHIFDHHAPGDSFSYLELLDKAEAQGRLYAIEHHGDWHHISTPDDLKRVDQDYEKKETTEQTRSING